MKVKEIIAIVEQDGWRLRGFTGSHRQYVHPVKPGKGDYPRSSERRFASKTAASILQQAGLEK